VNEMSNWPYMYVTTWEYKSFGSATNVALKKKKNDWAPFLVVHDLDSRFSLGLTINN